jgi:hypothetical protein
MHVADLIDNVLPSWRKSKTLALEKILPTLLIEIELPRCKTSATEHRL